MTNAPSTSLLDDNATLSGQITQTFSGNDTVETVSPMSQLLKSLGITRSELTRRNDQMRQFLTSRDDVIRPGTPSPALRAREATDPPPVTPAKRNIHKSAAATDRDVPARQRSLSCEKLSQGTLPHGLLDNQTRASGSQTPSSSRFNVDAYLQARAKARSGDPQGNGQLQPVTPQKNKYYRDESERTSLSKSRHASKSSSVLPVAPVILSPRPTYYRGSPPHLQPVAQKSSPPPVVSSPPPSSPIQRVVNLVSSPGPSSPYYDLPLPYTLPPPPYCKLKPPLSYAALIGRAILSSPAHALTLQDIYNYICTVFPHYRRGETTWMNSIRHVLSTTAAFRKVPRERRVGRTLWAIWDVDLPCFENGGFNRELCKDMASRKRGRGPDGSSDTPDGEDSPSRKRTKRTSQPDTSMFPPPPQVPGNAPQPYLLPLFPTPSVASAPLFQSTPTQQSYYESCVAQAQSHFASNAASLYPAMPLMYGPHFASALYPSISVAQQPPVQEMFPPIPTLSPVNAGSPSSSPPMASSNNLEELNDVLVVGTPTKPVAPYAAPTTPPTPSKRRAARESTMIVPAQFPTTPTPARRNVSASPTVIPHVSPTPASKAAGQPLSASSLATIALPSTPPKRPIPKNLTPPRGSNSKSSPRERSSAALAQHALKPPFSSPFTPSMFLAAIGATEEQYSDAEDAFFNTPYISAPFPTTPKRQPSSGDGNSPPFHGLLGTSPFRDQGIFDPHDPGAELDAELTRLSSSGADDSSSPGGTSTGLFGKGGLLYESPTYSSPGKWTRWW